MVESVPEENGDENELLAILFLDNPAPAEEGIVEKYDLNATAARRISDLEREYQESQNDLRSTISGWKR